MDAQRQATETAPVHVETRFGRFEVDPTSLISFPEGLPGFEQCRRFVVIAADEMAPLQCLHATDGPAASFLTIDPRLVLPGYRCRLSAHDTERLGATDDTPLLWLSIVTVQPDGSAYANLRAPIVINPSRMVAFQVMPHNTLYPLRQAITG